MDARAPIRSPAAFRQVLLDAACLDPARLAPKANLAATWIDTPLGPLIAISGAEAVHILEFPERRALPKSVARLLGPAGRLTIDGSNVADRAAHALDLYFTGQDPALDVPLAPQGTAFEHRHWQALHAIPAGETRTYAQAASTLGQPNAHRAVGRANGANPIAIAVPCHRLVASDGGLAGYGGGLWRKRWLIDHEAQHFGRHS